MATTRRELLAGAATGLLAATAGCAHVHEGDLTIGAILDRLATDTLRTQPEAASALNVSEAQAGGRYIDRLTDVSREQLARNRSMLRGALHDLENLDRSRLSERDKVTLDVVTTALRDNIADIAFEPSARFPYQITQLSGSYLTTPNFLATQHALGDRDQVDAYLARLSAYARVLDQDTTLLGFDAQRGIILPDFAMDRAIAQLQSFASTAPSETILVSSFARRLPNVAEIAEADRGAILSRVEGIVRDEVLPAYGRQIEALRALRSRASHDAGVWKLPDGDELYATALRVQTTTTMSADEIHRMGHELTAQCTSQLDAMFKTLGMSRGSVAERLTALGNQPDQHYPNTDEGRLQCLSDLNALVERATSALPQYFGATPRARLEIRRAPAYAEAGLAGGYYEPGAVDGSRPGAYYINLRDMSRVSKFGLASLSYHEGVPGHHWQLSIQQEAQDIPFYRGKLTFFGAYAEGWAHYAEQLMDEIGTYHSDPLGRIGYLSAAAFRAARLVVDTGMHAKRWSREQAIAAMHAVTGGTGVTEIERYAVWPAQACSYTVGKQALLRAREGARQRMGARFDIKRFHDTVLSNGSMPLSVVERLVRAWSNGA